MLGSLRRQWQRYAPHRHVASPPPSDLPAPRSLVRLEDSRPILRRILTETICDFWYPATIDTEHGGYGCNVDHAGRWSGATSRYLIGQARTLWFFSHLLRSGHGDTRHRDAARHGFAFLRDRMWDSDHGGFYWQVDAADGTVAKPDKQICGQSFALYALAEYALATGDDAARALAGDLFGLIDAEAHDPEQPGYFEMLTQDWSRVPDWNYMDRNPRHKTINTHLHLMEAFSTFYALTGDDLVRARLMELIHIQRDLVFRPEYDACSDSHLRDWTPVRRRWDSSVSYGHDLESIWLLADAREAIGEPVAPDLDTCRRIFASSLRHGFDRKRGGFYFLGPYKRPALHRQKIWWVQAESLVAALRMHGLTGESVYADCYRETLHWIVSAQVDWRHGEWHLEVAPNGRAFGAKGGAWKTPYHNGRAMIRCLQLLDGAGP